MDLIEDDRQRIDRPLCLMIGNFDGVHLGHQSIIAQARTLAAEHGLACAVLSFQPHPLKVLRPGRAPKLLQTPNQKRALLAYHGLDFYVVRTFDEALYTQSPERFVASLRERLNFKFLLVGFNFRFGYRRAGDTRTLAELGKTHGYETLVLAAHADGQGPVSSSRIRKLVAEGETVCAGELLGRPYFLEGVVDQGAQLGRNMSTPTANFTVANELKPRFGVYAGWCRLDGRDWYRAITNFGKAPTVARGEALCETHLFDFSGELYGRHIVVTLAQFLRPEKKFSDMDALKQQIQVDVANRLALPDVEAPAFPLNLHL